MKQILLILTSCCFLLALTSCFTLFDRDSDKIIDNYELAWIDTEESRSIYRKEELVDAYVFAVGHNSKFIVAKQHPNPGYTGINQSVTNYFIIKISDNEYNDRNDIFGPLNINQFDSLKTTLGVGKIEFDLVYPDKP